jgi:hypothetical protein
MGMLVGGLAGLTITLQRMMRDFGLSDAAKEEIVKHLAYPSLKDFAFTLDIEEFRKYVAYSSIELDNRSLLIAPSEKFEECFERQAIDEAENRYRFTTEGRVVDERVRGRK